MENKDVVVPEKFKDLVSKIETMSVIGRSELVHLLEEKFGVSAQASVAVPGPAAGAAAAEEKSSFNVELTAIGDQKIQVIKVVKDVLGLGLKEAKDIVDKAPAMIKEGLDKASAEALKKSIEDAGGKVTLK